MELNLHQNLEVNLDQHLELALSPKMLQTLKILNLAYPELLDKIEQESEENVLLEIEKADSLLEYVRYLNSDKTIKKEVDFREYPGLKNIEEAAKTLEQALIDQLEIESPDEPYKSICFELIKHIDQRGYIKNYPKIKKSLEKKFNVSRTTIDKALSIIQNFEPDGVGCRDLTECLLIQVREYNFENEALREILEKAIKTHLQDLSSGNFEKISQVLAIPTEGVERIAQFIKENLTPYPGSVFGETAREIVPSFAIEEGKEDTYKIINLERNYGPKLSLSKEYLAMLDSPKTDDKTKKYLKEKLAAAKELIDNINKRNETSDKILELITSVQTPFLKNGPSWLRPLLQKHIAMEVQVHPSTISRAVSKKYIQTPKGILPIKFLCQRDIRGVSTAKIQSIIKTITETEDRHNPLSDDEIKNILELQGIEIQRRTVAAYREKANIPASEKRKEK